MPLEKAAITTSTRFRTTELLLTGRAVHLPKHAHLGLSVIGRRIALNIATVKTARSTSAAIDVQGTPSPATSKEPKNISRNGRGFARSRGVPKAAAVAAQEASLTLRAPDVRKTTPSTIRASETTGPC